MTLSTSSGGTGDQSSTDETGEELLSPADVAKLFGVDPKTVTRWANNGKLHPIRTLGGHRRFPAGEIHRLLEEVDPRRD